MLTEEPNDAHTIYGGSVTFMCQATGHPDPNIIWKLNSKEIPLNDPRYHLLSDGTLKIENVDTTVVGSYECIAKNSLGEVKSRQARMTLGNGESSSSFESKPIISISPSSLVVTAHEPIILHCETEGIV